MSVRLSVVCRLSFVTFVHPTQAIEIFGNISTPFGTLAISDIWVKILLRSSQEYLRRGYKRKGSFINCVTLNGEEGVRSV